MALTKNQKTLMIVLGIPAGLIALCGILIVALPIVCVGLIVYALFILPKENRQKRYVIDRKAELKEMEIQLKFGRNRPLPERMEEVNKLFDFREPKNSNNVN